MQLQHFQIAGNSLERLLPSDIENYVMATVIPSGMGIMQMIGQSAAKPLQLKVKGYEEGSESRRKWG